MVWKCKHPYSPNLIPESPSTKHRMSRTPFYRKWSMFRKRCYNTNDRAYQNYGGRGINVCDRWNESFENFKDDMYESYMTHVAKHGYRDTTIDRIDVNGDYCKDNCRWATMKVQMNNRRRSSKNEFDGEVLTDSELAKKLGLSQSAIAQRRRKKADPLRRRKEAKTMVEIYGERMNLNQLSASTGIPYATLYRRFNMGIQTEMILEKVNQNKR